MTHSAQSHRECSRGVAKSGKRGKREGKDPRPQGAAGHRQRSSLVVSSKCKGAVGRPLGLLYVL